MNKEIQRLLKNIKTLVNANALEAEIEAAASDDDFEIETIEELNDYIEESMTYWE